MKPLCGRTHRQRGLTLVELMVALALGLFVTGVASLTYLQTASAARYGALASEMNEEGALALQMLRSQIALAGYSSLDASGRRVFTDLPVWGCDKGFADTGGAFGAPGTCNTGGPSNDAIAIGYEASLLNSMALLPVPGQPPAPGNCTGTAIAANAAGVFLADHRFYVDDDVNRTPSLFCRGGTGGGQRSTAALVPNVERLRLRYAITRATTAGAIAPHQVTGIVEASALVTADDWARVAAVEVCVLVRSARPVAADGQTLAQLTRHVACDGTVQTATDRYLRRAYRALVPLPNARPAIPRPFEASGGSVANPYAGLAP